MPDKINFPGIIRWPCDGLPFRKTVRASMYRHHFSREGHRALYAFFPFGIVAMFVAIKLYGNAGIWLGIAVLIVGPIFIGRVLNHRVRVGMRLQRTDPSSFVPGLKRGKKLCKQWRKQWAEFEEKSSEFIRLVRSKDSNLQAAEVLGKAPQLPKIWYQLTDPQDNTTPKITINRNHQAPGQILVTPDKEIADAQVQLFSEVARSLAFVQDRAVLGCATINGAWTLVHISMLQDNIQIWTMVQVQRAGLSLSCRLQTGYQWWFAEGYSDDGTHYEGDVRAFKRTVKDQDWKETGRIFFAMIPVVGWLMGFFACMGALFSLLKRTWRDLLYKEFSRQTLLQIGPDSGDAIDLVLISDNRTPERQSYYKFVLSEGSKAQISGVRQTIVNAFQETVSLFAESPRDRGRTNLASPKRGQVR